MTTESPNRTLDLEPATTAVDGGNEEKSHEAT
jgi:hypothetical protein